MNAFSYMNINGNGYYNKINGYKFSVEITGHGAWRKVGRGVQESAIYMTAEKGFEYITTLSHGERFLLIDPELLHTVVGAVYFYGDEVVVEVITVIDSLEPTNPKGTAEFYV